MRLLVDGLAYTLSPFGGLINYWNEVLPRLEQRGLEIELALGDRYRAEPPPLRGPEPGRADGFVSTYYTMPPDPTTPSLVVLHDVLYEADPGRVGASDDPKLIERKAEALAHAASVVCPSRATRDAAARYYSGLATATVIPHGLSQVFTTRADADADRAATRLLRDMQIAPPFLLHVGGRHGYKDFLSVLLALSLEDGIDARLSLLSVGSETAPTPAEARILNRCQQRRVAFAGYVDQRVLAALYRRSTAALCPSRGEGFGFVPVEAIGCGTALVCSDIAAHRETVARAATFYPAGDVTSLARAVRTAVRPSAGMVASVVAAHDWERAAESLACALVGLSARPISQHSD